MPVERLTLRGLQRAQLRGLEQRLALWSDLGPGSVLLAQLSALNASPPTAESGLVIEPERQRPSSQASQVVTARRLGMNRVRAYESTFVDGDDSCKARYGMDDAAFQDVVELGVNTVRHPGPCDLFWFALRHDPFDALVGLPVPASTSQLATDLASPSNEVELRRALRAAHSLGLKLSLTFLSNGGGSNQMTGPRPSDLECPSQVGLSDTTGLNSVLRMRWDTGHVDATSPSGTFKFPLDATDAASKNTNCLWHLDSLDVSSGYKREFIGLIGEQLGLFLTALEPTLGFDLDQVIESIEIFNEADARSTYNTDGSSFEPARTGDYWGRAVAWAAAGLRKGLEGSSGGPNIRLFLPAMSSYHDSLSRGVGKTWNERLGVMEALIGGLVAEIAVWGRTDDPAQPLPATLADLPDLVQGMDYHFYHRQDDRTHIGMLVHEVTLLKQTIEAAITAALKPTEFSDLAIGFTDLPITISESGASVCDVAEGGDCAGSPTWRPPGFGKTADEGERFQAYEVVRRLGGGLASAAELSGWHAWMSGPGGGLGVRYDLTPEDSSPSEAVPRPSWHAYRRFIERLGPVWGGTMILPASVDRSQLRGWLDSGSELTRQKAWCTVLEFTSGSPTVLHYLLLFEPTVPEDAVVTLTAWGTGISVVEQVDLFAPAPEPVPGRCILPTTFDPSTSSGYSADEPVVLPATWTLRPGDEPVLIRAEAPLSWSCKMDIAISPTSVPRALLWDDDWFERRVHSVWSNYLGRIG